MYIIIVGCGRLGCTLAKELSDADYNVSVIDSDSQKLDTLGGGFNGLRIKGVEFDLDVLKEAGIQQADCFVSVTPEDNLNITASLIAKKIFNIPRIVARINEPKKKSIYDSLEIETINPTEISAFILKSRIEEYHK
jgi:trk system potassium uptake protein